MKQFLKFMLASMLGFILAATLSLLILIAVIAAAVSSKDNVTVPEKAILHITLNQPVPDRTSADPFSSMNFGGQSLSQPLGLNDILRSLKKAETDDHIKGIFLDLSTVEAGMATTDEIRDALEGFRKSGKFIISYSEGYSQKSYYLASVSDKIYLNPAGDMEFKGLTGQVMFFKGLLNKLDVQPQVIRHGKFKSAIEPFINDKMSDASKEQTSLLINNVWQHMLVNIQKSRNISTDSLRMIADNFLIQSADDAVKYRFVDKLIFKDQLLDEFKSRTEVKNVKDLRLIKLAKYSQSMAQKTDQKQSGDKIAVVYAEGSIVSGEADDSQVGSERISKAIRKARLDDKVKAVVLRVNSPGGSALASDVIWREMVLTREKKPVVVSMGNVAASGGYYISCAASKIYANPNTITGSIGVFGIIPNLKEFFNQNLGITFDEVKTNPYADYIPVTRPMSDQEKKFLTRDIEDIYSTFLNHVSDGRKIEVAQVDSIGQGRVWSGTEAKRLGLVDEFGGLDAAIAEAAKLAKIKDYKTIDLPEQKDTFTKIIESLSGDNTKALLRKELGVSYSYLEYLQKVSRMQGIQALMPFEITIK